MRQWSVSIAAVFVAAAPLLSSPADAIDGRGAIVLCERNPQCRFEVNDGGGVYLYVGDNIIFCPPRGGQCECVGGCSHPQHQGVGQGRRGGSVDGVLSGNPAPAGPRAPLGGAAQR